MDSWTPPFFEEDFGPLPGEYVWILVLAAALIFAWVVWRFRRMVREDGG